MPTHPPLAALLLGTCLAGAALPAVAESSGAKVFDAHCKTCHEAPKDKQNGAPQRGDADEWKERSGVGRPELYRRAIEGWQGYFTMPAKGGDPTLKDDDVKAAVDYLMGAAP